MERKEKSLGEQQGWCRDCNYAAVCLPRGHASFTAMFEYSIYVRGHIDGNDVLNSINERIKGLLCQCGRRSFDMGVPKTLEELKPYIRGYARGVSEVVCDLLGSGKDATVCIEDEDALL